MSKDEALKLARELDGVIEDVEQGNGFDNVCLGTIKYVRDALADSALDRMAENARELGLDYEPIVEQVEDSVGMGHKAWDMVDPKELAKEFHKALAEPPCKTGSQCTSKCQQCEQPAQQPHCNDCGGFDPECPLSQPSKPWVGLTEKEHTDIAIQCGCMSADWVFYGATVERILKEKNS